MAFNLLAPRKKKPNQFVSDPSQLTPTPTQTRPTFQFDFRSLPGGATEIRRQTTEQANRPPIPAFTPGPTWNRQGVLPAPNRGRIWNVATLRPGTDLTGPQFPWQMKRGISSDASRQAAFRFGFGSGEGRTGFARKAPGSFFDPRFMFDPGFQQWRQGQRALRR